MNKPTLSLVIPVYNEALRLPLAFQALTTDIRDLPLTIKEIIFIDDGSQDETRSMINCWQPPNSRITKQILSYSPNRGKGNAVKKGLLTATSDYVLIMDVDVSTPLSELKKFSPYINQSTSLIIGTRKNGWSTVIVAQPLFRQLLGRGFTLLTQLILNTWNSDFTCGFKLFSKSAYMQIGKMMRINRWGYDAELLFLAHKYDYQVQEIPVKWINDARSKVDLRKDILLSLKDLLWIKWLDMTGVYENNIQKNNFVERMFSWVNLDWS